MAASKIIDTYTHRGLWGLLREIWIRLTRRYPLVYLFDYVFGDRLHEKLVMAPVVGYCPRLEDPRSFNEKIVHRKLYSDRLVYSEVSCKYRVRDFVAERVDDDILTELYHVTEDPETIPFDDLPDQFVVKATHGQGMNVLVKDKSEVDFEAVRTDCRNWLREPFGVHQREYWYREITPRIVVEELLQNEDGSVPEDYKFYVFDGEVQYVHVDENRFGEHERRFYDASWNALDFRRTYPLAAVSEEPPNFERMKSIAEALAADFEFARIDLYDLGSDGVAFGEITLAPGSGHARFDPKAADFELGACW